MVPLSVNASKFSSTNLEDMIEQAIWKKNVEKVSDAQIFLFFDDHESRHHRRFHASVIDHLYQYKRHDWILVEDSAIKKPSELNTGQIAYLKKKKMNVAGWDSPQALNCFEKLAISNRKIYAAIRDIDAIGMNDPSAEKSTIQDLCQKLIITVKQEVYSSSDAKRYSVFEQQVEGNNDCERGIGKLIDAARHFIDDRLLEHFLETDHIRQLNLIFAINRLVDKGKIFVVLGGFHARLNENNPIPKELVQRVHSYLETKTYVMLEPKNVPENLVDALHSQDVDERGSLLSQTFLPLGSIAARIQRESLKAFDYLCSFRNTQN